MDRGEKVPEGARCPSPPSSVRRPRGRAGASAPSCPARKASPRLVEIHTTLLEATRDRHLAGVVREEQNWIGGRGFSPADAEFIPPPPEFVEHLLIDLVEFVNRDDLPASLQAAAAHAQFETIHPFIDR